MQTYYDIAVLEIEEVTFSPLVRPICLPEQDFLPGVNFINVLRTRFWYKRAFLCYVLVKKSLSYTKRARKMLMKFITDAHDTYWMGID